MVIAMASKGDRPCRRPVPMTERTAAKNSAPHSERVPFVTLRNITLARSARSKSLF